MPDTPHPTLELVGAGFGRTGTLSLKAALETLGKAPCHHMMEVMQNPGSEKAWLEAAEAKDRGEPYPWPSLVAGYRAAVDWPGCHFWREFADAFPEAPVLLSTRDPDKWYESAHETIYQVIVRARTSEDPAVRERMRMADGIIFRGTFRDRFEDREFAKSVFVAHLEEVQREIPRDRLLVYQVGEGWEPLCRFLGCEIPDLPFPHVNSRDEFRAMLKHATAGPDAGAGS
jgi:hypothetical protein